MSRKEFFTVLEIGPKRQKTNEGFLICFDVPIARTGDQVYMADEVPGLTPGPDGFVIVERLPQEVFRPETIASFNGKAVVYEHPMDDVTPYNFSVLAKGYTINPRRGTGLQDNLLLADLFITDEMTMLAIEQGKREVSCGYRADYYEIAPGRGGQKNIIGNHVALVDRGRCGSECSIGDRRVCDCQFCKEKTMSKKVTLKDRFMALLGAADDKAFNDALAREVGDEDPDEKERERKAEDAAWRGATDKRIGDLEGSMRTCADSVKACGDAIRDGMADMKKALDTFGKARKDEDPDEEKKKKEATDAAESEAEMEEEGGKDAAKAKDSAPFADSFQNTVALAEILAPGISVPSYDKAAEPKKTYDALCGLRRTALELAYARAETRGAIDSVLAGKVLDLKGMKCRDVRALFMSAGAIQKDRNRVASLANKGEGSKTAAPAGAIKSLSDYNNANRDYYKSVGKAN